MDPQLKKGVLEACILAAISRRESYGYQIVRDVAEHIEISESTLYPILRRLESQGALVTYSVEHNGRLRKYYRITATGLERIGDFLNSWPQISAVYDYIRGGNHE